MVPSVTLVASLWANQEWSSDLLHLLVLVAKPLEFPRLCNLLVQPHVKKFYWALGIIVLYLWKLSSNLSERQAFWSSCTGSHCKYQNAFINQESGQSYMLGAGKEHLSKQSSCTTELISSSTWGEIKGFWNQQWRDTCSTQPRLFPSWYLFG